MELTLITAYFDIGRDKFKGYERGNDKYINYFKFWARMRNKLIVYTSSQFKDEIMEIRSDFGLKEQTKIIVIDDFRQFDIDLYRRIHHAMNNEISLNFHKDINRPEAYSADYNYIMMLKSYCIVDAINNNYANGMIAWIDFGFNHGGNDGLIKQEEFDFLWQYDFSSKIHLFTYQEVDTNRPIFDIVRSMDVYIRGNIMIAPDYLWEEFFTLAKDSMISLTRCGLCDDDQTIELMAYYEKPDIFELHDVEHWYDGLKCFGGEHLTTKQEKPKKNKPYKKYKERAILFLSDGKFKLARKYYKQYLITKLKTKLFK